jgi:hypothetical protein
VIKGAPNRHTHTHTHTRAHTHAHTHEQQPHINHTFSANFQVAHRDYRKALTALLKGTSGAITATTSDASGQGLVAVRGDGRVELALQFKVGRGAVLARQRDGGMGAPHLAAGC